MPQHRSRGFAPVEILIVLVIVIAIAAVGYLVLGKDRMSGSKLTPAEIAAEQQRQAANSKSTKVAPKTPSPEKPPVLQNLAGISFGPYSPASQVSGDFIFSKAAANQAAPGVNMIFYPFGQKVCPTGSDCKIVTEMTFLGLKLGTPVKAAAAGKVSGLKQDGVTSSFVTVSDDYNGYAVGYDHVYQSTVKEGQMLKVGQTVGKVAPYGDWVFGRVELFVKKSSASTEITTVKVCPFDYLDPQLQSTAVPAMYQFLKDWNTFFGSEVYKPTDMVTPGCMAKQTVE